MNVLILVDIQNDFLPGGALPVPEGDAVIPIANRLQEGGRFDLVVATQDWHPAGHGSFAANHPGRTVGEVIDLNGLPQILWPVHCVQETRGAAFADGLATMTIEKVFPKGTDPAIDSYSGFFDNGHRKSTGLGDYLRARGVTDVYVCGLATDYCVKFTALDARQLGFNTFLVEDASRGVNLKPGDVDAAAKEMRAAGVKVVTRADGEEGRAADSI
jgi:nicotinamidase/pyrazinamidase